MTIASEISRLQTAKADIKSSIEWKWVTVPSSAKLDSYDDYIDQIEQGWWYDWPYDLLDYSAMQWPAPDGFHVPFHREWNDVKTIWTTLWGWSSDWTNFWIVLKLPFAGHRDGSSADVNYQGTYGYYWSSRRLNINNAYCLYLKPSSITSYGDIVRSRGGSVRCFKNSPTIPTSSWTKLYWTSIEAGWIFWSSTDWLISLSSNWTDWITMQDKNLWATTVWNSWDTLSESNCGKYYQWGNNYWFPRTWSVTTSSTQVDASTYWPWNYYSSSTFITRSSYPYSWDSTDNWNLRWWDTWIQTIWQYIKIDNINYKHLYISKSDMLSSDINSVIDELNQYPEYYYSLLTTWSYPKLVSVYKDSSLSDRILLIWSWWAYLSCYDWNTNTYVWWMSQWLKTWSFVQYENWEFKLCTSWYNSNAIL